MKTNLLIVMILLSCCFFACNGNTDGTNSTAKEIIELEKEIEVNDSLSNSLDKKIIKIDSISNELDQLMDKLN